MKLLFSVVTLALVLTASTAYAQQSSSGMKPAMAKCILSNLDKVHTDKAVNVLIAACKSLTK